MAKRQFRPTPNDISVYIELLGVDDGLTKTQLQVRELLNLSAGGVNRIVQKLLNEGIIRKKDSSRSNITYEGGDRETEISKLITSDYLEARRNELIANQRGRFPTSKEKYRQIANLLSLTLPLKAHFPFTPPRFKVVKQGNMDFTNEISIEGRRPIRLPIFTKPKVEGLQGQDKFISSFSTDGDRFEITFLKTHPKKKASEMKMMVQPFDDVEFLITDVETNYDVGMLIVKQCHKVLNFLQKYAGWEFAYEPLNEVERVHILCSDDDINRKIEELTGRKIHELEQYKFWTDNSHGRQTHVESAVLSFFKALDKLPEAVVDVENIKEQVNELNRKNETSELHDTIRDFELERIKADVKELKEHAKDAKDVLKDHTEVLQDHAESLDSVALFENTITDILIPEKTAKQTPEPMPAFDRGLMYR